MIIGELNERNKRNRSSSSVFKSNWNLELLEGVKPEYLVTNAGLSLTFLAEGQLQAGKTI